MKNPRMIIARMFIHQGTCQRLIETSHRARILRRWIILIKRKKIMLSLRMVLRLVFCMMISWPEALYTFLYYPAECVAVNSEPNI